MIGVSVGLSRDKAIPVQLLILMLPVELAMAQLAHGLFKHVLPAPGLLLHPLLALLVVLIASRRLTRADLMRQDTVVLVGAGMMAFPCVYHLVQGNQWDLRFLLLGVVPLLLGLMWARMRDMSLVTRPLAIGLMLWCTAIVLAFIADTLQLLEFHAHAREYSLDQLILAMRYPNSIDFGLYYPVLTGNWNKASNIIVLSSMLMMIAIYRDRAARTLYLAAMAVMAVVSLLSYSRGGLLVSAGLGAFNLVLLPWIKPEDRRAWALGAGLMMLPLVVSLLLPAMRLRWFDMSSVDERVDMIEAVDLKTAMRAPFSLTVRSASSAGADAGFLAVAMAAIANTLLPIWDWLVDVVRQVMIVLAGLGVGTYGMQIKGSPFAGTHNMLLDMFIAGGALQVGGLLLLLAWAWLAVLRRGFGDVPRLIAGMAMVAMLVLSFREFDLNYLGVSALPALLLGWFMGEALGRTPGAQAQRRESA